MIEYALFSLLIVFNIVNFFKLKKINEKQSFIISGEEMAKPIVAATTKMLENHLMQINDITKSVNEKICSVDSHINNAELIADRFHREVLSALAEKTMQYGGQTHLHDVEVISNSIKTKIKGK